MISIVTSIHNQLGMNQLFYEYLIKYSSLPFELIVIDNNSTDGSTDFFETTNAIIIKNRGNYSYPYCQNQGIKKAQYDFIFFLNNDVLVGPNWDKILLEEMSTHQLDIISGCGTNRLITVQQTSRHMTRWKWTKTPIITFSKSAKALRLAHHLMFKNWEEFVTNQSNNTQIVEGYAGFNIMIHRSALSKIGLWDERILAADEDIFLRTKKRHIEHNDIKPIHLTSRVYFHHFLRLTFKSNYTEFVDANKLISLSEKWQSEERNKLLVEMRLAYGR